MSPKEFYQVHYNFQEKVLRIPKNIDFFNNLKRLPYQGFACCSPCDGASETPQVPASLPRTIPVGKYFWGAFMDEDTLYVVLDSIEGTSIEALQDREDSLDQLIIFHPDGLWYRTLQITLEGTLQTSSVPYQHGPRRLPQCNEPEWNWNAKRWSRGKKQWRTLWQIAKANLLPHVRNGVLRMSLSKTSVRDREAVAWGSYGIWGPRFDECGSLLFESKPLFTPILRELNLEYNPLEERGTLHFKWEDVFKKSETIPCHPMETWRRQNWDIFTARVNGVLQQFSFSDTIKSNPFCLQDGFNEIHISTRGGTALRFFLEIVPDTRIISVANRIKNNKLVSKSDIQKWVKRELSRYTNQGETSWKHYYSRMCGLGSAVAIWYSCFEPDKVHWKNWLEKLGNFTLTLQRKDGTFAGSHLERNGQTDIRWKGGAYDSGQVGEFWIRTWKATGQNKFLKASERLVHTYKDYRIEFNPNYAAFAIFHLATHYKLTQEPVALAHVEYYLEYCVMPNILPLGFHSGHNYYTVYASIILRAMCLAASILPEDHRLRERLLRLIHRMCNQTLIRLQSNGKLDSRDRHFNGETQWSSGLFLVLPFLKNEDQLNLKNVLQFILEKSLNTGRKEKVPFNGLVLNQPVSMGASPSLLEWLDSMPSEF